MTKATGKSLSAKVLCAFSAPYKPKLFDPDIFQWGRGLPREGVGAQKFAVCPSKPGKSNFLAGISRDFAGTSQRCLKSLRKMFVFSFWPLIYWVPI